jgi:UDP-3-O-[3-hydroxymyristoyl] N-acetylglucosamine deacetylase
MARRHLGSQTTLRNRATVSGVGVHSGQQVAVTLHPAEADTGIYFYRANLGDGREHEVPADFRHVRATDLCTTVGADGISVATVEHLMATLRALEIDNAMVEIDGPEIPVMDGSAEAFVDAVEQAGITRLGPRRRYIRIEKPVRVQLGPSFAEFRPHDGMRVEVEIEFANPLIGSQSFAMEVNPANFRKHVARARTFGFLADVEQLWARGLCLGGSLENAVVVADDRILNPDGLRFPDEFVRHKTLDAIGDLALASLPILGSYRSHRGGHRLNVTALTALFADQTAWSLVEATAPREARETSPHPDLAAALSAAVFLPEAS